MVAEHGASERIRIRSGGIANYARDGMLPSLDARIVLREDGIELAEDGLASTDLKRHRHRMAEADLILTMTAAQKDLVGVYTEAGGTPLFTLQELAGEQRRTRRPPPAGGGRFSPLPGRDQGLSRSRPRPPLGHAGRSAGPPRSALSRFRTRISSRRLGRRRPSPPPARH